MIFIAAILSIITYRQRNWKTAADAAIAEMKVHQTAAERLRLTNSEQAIEIGKLRAQTDLKPLVDAISSWVVEGRARFESAQTKLDTVHSEQRVKLDQVHTEQTNSLRAMMEEMRAQRIASEDAYRTLSTAFVSHNIEDERNQLEVRRINERFIGMLDAMERRLSEVAVTIGLSKWGPEHPAQTSVSAKGNAS
jgi:hypothetical protein